MSKNLRLKLRNYLSKNEILRFQIDNVELSDDDLDFIVHTIWKSKCCVCGKRFGGHDALSLTRWDPSQPVTVYNLVLLSQSNLNIILKLGRESLPAHIQRSINSRLAWAKSFSSDDNYGDELKLTIDGLKRTKHIKVSNVVVTSNILITVLCVSSFVGGLLLGMRLRSIS